MALDIKNWGFQLKMAEGGSRDKKKQQKFGKLTVDQAVDRFVRAGNLKRPPPPSSALHFLTFSPPELAAPSHTCFQRPF